MTLGLIAGLALVVVLIALNGVFVAGEFCLLAVDGSQVEVMSAEGSRRARGVRALLRRLSFHLAGAQLGITLTSLVLGILAESTIGGLLEWALGSAGSTLSATGVVAVVAIAAAAVMQMVFGELLPKNLAVSRPMGTALVLAPVLRLYGLLTGPVTKLFNGIANASVRACGLQPAEELRIVRTRDELEYVVRSSRRRTLSDAQADLLVRTLRLGQKDAADALTPRTAMSAVDADATLSQLVELARASGHSRLPVLGASPDDVLGLAEVRDVFGVHASARDRTPVRQIMRPIVAVAESRKLDGVLADMSAADCRLCVVVDEHGGTAGIVTREDIAEELVGDIADEFDEPGAFTPRLAGGSATLPGSTTLDELEAATGLAVPDGPYETLAGFVLERLGAIPVVGASFEWNSWLLTVTELDGLRIAEVQLTVAPEGHRDGDTKKSSPIQDSTADGAAP
ncbi:hemolysin family protein [Candidatus Poriferisodalis sp.]|uniref:hemolysin family protein n=1 Tax=Candidatus Poriferisodalis sp. TaxID=3101277 RepID=UPI003B0260D3